MKNIIKLGLAATVLAGSLYGQAEFTAKGKSTESIRINGRVHAQYETLSTDLSGAADPATTNQFILRRVYLGAKGKLASDFTGEINTSFAKNDGKLDKAIVTYKNNDAFKLDIGYKKAPLGFEENTSSSKIKTVERSVVTRYLNEQHEIGARHTGLHASGSFDGGLYYAASITDTEQGKTSGHKGEKNEMNLYGRLGFKGETDSFTYDVGAGYAVANEVSSADDTQVWELYGNFGFGNFNLLVDLLKADTDIPGASDADAFGFVIQPSFKVSDEWELVASYANLDADAKDIDISDTTRNANDTGASTYEEVDQFYFGANWFIDGNNVKLTFGYEIADYEGAAGVADADVQGLRARLQLLF